MRYPLWVQKYGHSPSQPTIVLLPGAMSTSAEWPQSLLGGLSNNGFNLVLMDHRNSGRSRWYDEEYTLNDMADDVSHTLITHRINNCHIVGASMGGAIAQLVSMKRHETVRSLTLLMSTSERGIWSKSVPPPLKTCMSGITRAAKCKDVSKGLIMRYKTLANGENISEEEFKNIAERVLRHGYNPNTDHLNAFMRSDARTGFLSHITCKTLIVHGSHDPLFKMAHASLINENMHSSKMVVIDKVGHHLSEKTGHLLTEHISVHCKDA